MILRILGAPNNPFNSAGRPGFFSLKRPENKITLTKTKRNMLTRIPQTPKALTSTGHHMSAQPRGAHEGNQRTGFGSGVLPDFTSATKKNCTSETWLKNNPATKRNHPVIQKDVFMPATKAPQPSFGGLPMAPAIVEMRITWTMAEKLTSKLPPPRFTQNKKVWQTLINGWWFLDS